MNSKLAAGIGKAMGVLCKSAGPLTPAGSGLIMGAVKKPMLGAGPPKPMGAGPATTAATAQPTSQSSDQEPPAPISLNSGAAPKEQLPGVLSIRPEDSAGTDASGVISLGMDPAQRKALQTGGAAPQPGQPGQPGASDMWQMNDPDTNAYAQKYMQMYTGFGNPGQYAAWRGAQNAGMGRAMRAAMDRQWLQGMFGGI